MLDRRAGTKRVQRGKQKTGIASSVKVRGRIHLLLVILLTRYIVSHRPTRRSALRNMHGRLLRCMLLCTASKGKPQKPFRKISSSSWEEHAEQTFSERSGTCRAKWARGTSIASFPYFSDARCRWIWKRTNRKAWRILSRPPRLSPTSYSVHNRPWALTRANGSLNDQNIYLCV